MSTYDKFLEARALSEALLLLHAIEGSSSSEQFGIAQDVDRAFSKLSSKMGFKVERLPPLQHSTMDARTQGLRHG